MKYSRSTGRKKGGEVRPSDCFASKPLRKKGEKEIRRKGRAVPALHVFQIFIMAGG